MFEKQERLGIIVYLYYNRDARKLNRYGDMIYHSRRFRYVHLYLDADKLEETLETLKKLKFVKRVRLSHFDEIDRNLVGSLYREEISQSWRRTSLKRFIASKGPIPLRLNVINFYARQSVRLGLFLLKFSN